MNASHLLPRRACLLLSALGLMPLLALAQPASKLPSRNLWVEMRWVESRMDGASLAGVRDGAVVVGTGGSVSPTPGVSLSTSSHSQSGQQTQRVLVLNGRQAQFQLNEKVPVQWVDVSVQMDGAAAAGGGAPNMADARVRAVPRSGFVEQTRGFTVAVFWPGGQQPARLDLKVQTPSGEPGPNGQPAGQTQLDSSVQLRLGEWLTVARTGVAVQAQERGVLSTRAAESQTQRELQLRVDLAP